MKTKHIHHKKTATKTKSKQTTRTKPNTPPGYTYVRHVPHCLILVESIRNMYTDSNTGALYALPIFDEMGEMIIGGATWTELATAYINVYYSGDVTWFYELPSSLSVPLPGGLCGQPALALKIDYSKCNSSEFLMVVFIKLTRRGKNMLAVDLAHTYRLERLRSPSPTRV